MIAQARATTTVSVYRGTTTDTYGDEVDANDAGNRVHRRLPMAISQGPARQSQPADGDTRVVRTYTGRCPGVDVRKDDRVQCERTAVVYLVTAVTTPSSPYGTPDTVLTLTRTT